MFVELVLIIFSQKNLRMHLPKNRSKNEHRGLKKTKYITIGSRPAL